MRKQHKVRIERKALLCCLLLAVASALTGQESAPESRPDWSQSPYRSFGPGRALSAGIVLRDEADDPALREALSGMVSSLSADLFGDQGWPNPFTSRDPLRILVTRTEAGGVRRLVSRSVDRRHLVGASIQIDGSHLTDDQIVGEAARLIALSAISAYGVPDRSFLTAAAADLLSRCADAPADVEARREAAAAPAVSLSGNATTLGRLLLEEFERSAGGRPAIRQIWERSSERGEEPLASLSKIYAEKSGEPEDALLLRFAARLYSTVETDAGPSAIGRWDLEAGSLDAGAPEAWTLQHRTFVPAESAGALKFSWPAGAAHAAAIVRYRDAALPPDVVFLEPDTAHAIALPGVARVDWVLAGSANPGPSAPVFFESANGYPFAGLQPHAVPQPEGARLWWTTSSHEGLSGWAIFREEVLADGRIARVGPEIVPASNDASESFRYAYVDPTGRGGTFYRYSVWAVTGDGLLTKAFSATLRTPE
jgi:hypothetical protein